MKVTLTPEPNTERTDMTELSADLSLADAEARESRERERFEAWELTYFPPAGWGPRDVMFDAWLARAALAPAVPPGWKLVPVEPTPEMVAAIPYPLSVTPNTGIQCYSAMLKAAPSTADGRRPHGHLHGVRQARR